MVYVLFVCTVQKVFSFLDIQKVNYVGKTLYPCKCSIRVRGPAREASWKLINTSQK